MVRPIIVRKCPILRQITRPIQARMTPPIQFKVFSFYSPHLLVLPQLPPVVLVLFPGDVAGMYVTQQGVRLLLRQAGRHRAALWFVAAAEGTSDGSLGSWCLARGGTEVFCRAGWLPILSVNASPAGQNT